MKFRIWNKSLGCFVSSDEWFVNGLGEIFYYEIMDGELVNADKSNCIIQKFTELYDRNKNPIYEGDKLIYPSHKDNGDMIVEYQFGRWVLNDMEDLDDYWADNVDVGNITTLQIIGNIFEK
jgi:hypothetical protein